MALEPLIPKTPPFVISETIPCATYTIFAFSQCIKQEKICIHQRHRETVTVPERQLRQESKLQRIYSAPMDSYTSYQAISHQRTYSPPRHHPLYGG